jgi:hypothetical protein
LVLTELIDELHKGWDEDGGLERVERTLRASFLFRPQPPSLQARVQFQTVQFQTFNSAPKNHSFPPSWQQEAMARRFGGLRESIEPRVIPGAHLNFSHPLTSLSGTQGGAESGPTTCISPRGKRHTTVARLGPVARDPYKCLRIPSIAQGCSFPQIQPLSMIHPQNQSPKIAERHPHSAWQRNRALPQQERERLHVHRGGVVTPVSASLDLGVESS